MHDGTDRGDAAQPVGSQPAPLPPHMDPRGRRHAHHAAAAHAAASAPAQGDAAARRFADAEVPATPSSSRPRRRVGRTLLRLCLATSVAAAATGGSAGVYYSSLIERQEVFTSASRPAPSAAGVRNILIVGSDVREGMDAATTETLGVGSAKDAPGRRSDTMILLHLSPSGPATAVSVPRDSWVTIPAHRNATGTSVAAEQHRINAAYAFGGPALAVATVEHNTGVRIDSYLEVNFAAFASLVDALGGIDMCLSEPLYDSKLNFRLPAGPQTLHGPQALSFVRARYVDGRGDLGRIERQQQFLSAVAAELGQLNLRQPLAVHRLATATLPHLTADADLSTLDLARLAWTLKNSPSMQFTTVPLGRVGNTVEWDPVKAPALFAQLRDGLAEPAGMVVPSQVKVRVLNASGVTGLAAQAAQTLEQAGFVVVEVGNAPLSSGGAVVRHGTDAAAAARALAAAVDGELELDSSLGEVVELHLGRAWVQQMRDRHGSAARGAAVQGAAVQGAAVRGAAGPAAC